MGGRPCGRFGAVWADGHVGGVNARRYCACVFILEVGSLGTREDDRHEETRAIEQTNERLRCS